ncbi:Addiction module antitoxin [uncultured Pleomorphomonas sp.]|uniref:Addiction module antitoxin n=2 Tax=uncultured Pleomorphomonas sp. TaxID=442121 RepID=A0A212L0U7_9HYPH|nr:Addiction module antitoxin [uncultured Pleomorphomonas sp.]
MTISMRMIERTTAFERDFKREVEGRHRGILDTELRRVIVALASGEPLEPRHRNRALSNDWKDYRGCHVKPDLVLIYRLVGDDRLILARLGSHAEIDL